MTLLTFRYPPGSNMRLIRPVDEFYPPIPEETMTFIVNLENGTIVGPFNSEDSAVEWGEKCGRDYDVTVLVPPQYANYIQRIVEVNE